jgi:hypothetical protein
MEEQEDEAFTKINNFMDVEGRKTTKFKHLRTQ